MRPLLALMLVGCGAGPNEETLVPDLRVVAIASDPPEAAPGEAFTVEAFVADPKASGADVAVWTCAGFAGTCAEADVDRLEVVEDVVGSVIVDLPMPVELAGAVAAGEVPVTVWAVACAPGLCPLFDGPVSAEDLADPTSWVAALPLDGVSLARRTVWASSRPPEERRQNPTLIPQFAELPSVEPAAPIELTFAVDGVATEVFGHATAGGFDMPAFPVEDGVVTATWYAPEEPGTVTLWVVSRADDAGTAVWTGTIDVR
jgi:hypothetical protein